MCLIKKLKIIGKKIIYGPKCDSSTYISYLRSKGAEIGDEVELFSIRNLHIDELNPHLLKIGNNVKIVGSEILTHDYSWSVIKGVNGEILGNQKQVIIGNNVFIGHGSVVLCGTVIEDNVIVGANSVVSGRLISNSVYAGSPAKKIMSLDSYIEKRRAAQYQEARSVVRNYFDRFGCTPKEEVLHEYFFLFTNDTNLLNPAFEKKLRECGNYEQSFDCFNLHEPMFASYESFLASCFT